MALYYTFSAVFPSTLFHVKVSSIKQEQQQNVHLATHSCIHQAYGPASRKMYDLLSLAVIKKLSKAVSCILDEFLHPLQLQ